MEFSCSASCSRNKQCQESAATMDLLRSHIAHLEPETKPDAPRADCPATAECHAPVECPALVVCPAPVECPSSVECPPPVECPAPVVCPAAIECPAPVECSCGDTAAFTTQLVECSRIRVQLKAELDIARFAKEELKIQLEKANAGCPVSEADQVKADLEAARLRERE